MFLGFPLLGLVLSNYVDLQAYKKYFLWAFLLFTTHNLLFYLGFSLKGDYPDYLIFSLEYLYLSLTIYRLYKVRNLTSKILRGIGTTILILGFLQGVVGILLFIVVSQDYETDQIYTFVSDNKDYQTRRYSFGFATLDDTRHTFETYRRYKYLPFEKLINKTDLFALKSGLNFGDGSFRVAMTNRNKKQILEFSSSEGKTHTVTVD